MFPQAGVAAQVESCGAIMDPRRAGIGANVTSECVRVNAYSCRPFPDFGENQFKSLLKVESRHFAMP